MAKHDVRSPHHEGLLILQGGIDMQFNEERWRLSAQSLVSVNSPAYKYPGASSVVLGVSWVVPRGWEVPLRC